MLTVQIALVLFLFSRLIETKDGLALIFWGSVLVLLASCESDYMVFFR
jgi:hypothetical protein